MVFHVDDFDVSRLVVCKITHTLLFECLFDGFSGL